MTYKKTKEVCKMPPVLILCGGKGTRLRDVTELLPKPMVPIGEQPILWHIMKSYAAFGCRRFILCLGYKREAFVDYFVNYHLRTSDATITLGHSPKIKFHENVPEGDWEVTLAGTGLETGTGGRVFQAARYLKPSDREFFLTYGDGVADVDVAALLKTHRAAAREITVTAVHPAARFGEMVTEGDRIVRFEEKPAVAQGYINGGFMVVSRGFLKKYLTDDPQMFFERDPMQNAAAAGDMTIYRHEGFWQCMDTSREYQMLNELWGDGQGALDTALEWSEVFMTVSVFIPYYNDVKFLGQAIEAVLAQTFRDFELILLNHASTDGSRDLARKYTDARIRHIDVPVNYGAGAGVNLKSFLNVATGDFVKLLCADDILRSNGLELLVDAAERHPGIDAVFGDCAFSDADGVPGEETIFGRATRLLGTDDFYSGQYDNAKLLPLLVRGWTPWPYPGAFVKRTLLQDLSFDVSMIMYFDISLWIDLIIHGAHVAFVKQPILNYRVHTGQTSSQSQKQRIATAVGFEAEKLAARIAACGQPDLIKRAFADSPYAAKCETARDAYFVANEWLLRNLKSRASYCALSSLLDDDAARARLADRFGFTVRTLRGLYMEWDEATRPHATGFKAWKKKVKAATGESLGVAGLSWLLADRIWKNITFKNRN